MAHTDNIIPTMTSNSAPSGVASVSGEYSSGYAAWRAFDHVNGPIGWCVNEPTGYLRYQFPTPRIVTRYAVTTRNTAPAGNMPPRTWTFQGSNDGVEWTTLDAQTDIIDWANLEGERKVFDLVNTTTYAYYQLYITESNTGAWVGVGELEMMETVSVLIRSGRFPVLSRVCRGM